MKILCAYSGIHFTCEHFPASLHARECYHPVFDIPQKKLLACLPKWVAHELTETDSYLLYLALLNSTSLVEWRVPAMQTERTRSIVANHMEPLVKTVGAMNLIKHPALALSKVAITPETKFLDTSHYWIANWNESINDFHTGYRQAIRHDRLVMRERALEKIIRDPEKKDTRYLARNLADWAADAGCFPQFTLVFESRGMTCEEYWKIIIIRCINDEQVFKLHKPDIQELIEHCEENIEPGTIYHHALMQVLRNGLKRRDNYLGSFGGDIDAASYRILDAETSIEDANKLAMIADAPAEKPIESNYPSKIAYLRAKAKWDMATEYKKQIAAKESTNTTANTTEIL